MIHGRGKHDGSLGGQTQGGQQIIGQSVGQPGDDVGGSRRNEHHIRPARQLDMAHGGLRLLIEKRCMNRLARDRLETQRSDEILCPAGHHHAYLVAALTQSPHQVRALVGGDAP